MASIPYGHYVAGEAQSVTTQTLQPVLVLLSYGLSQAEKGFNAIPGSAVLLRYIRESHRDDPGRTLLEILLALFALWTVVQGRRRAEREAKNFVKLSEQEVDDLVDDWMPEPLVPPLSSAAFSTLSKTPIIVGPAGPRPRVTNSLIDPNLALSPTNPVVDPALLLTAKTKEVINLASFNFTTPPSSAGTTNSPKNSTDPLPGTETAIATLRKYGLGSCGPPGFYGTIDVHLALEKAISSFLGTESAIIYSQSFATASSVIPAFCKRGDIIVADRGVNFVIQKGMQLSRSTIRWYDHNSLRASNSTSTLAAVLEQLEKDLKRKKAPLTRKFIVTEGLFADTGSLTDLPVLLSIAKKYKYRIILDESFSIGTLGRTGRGLTELFNVPATEVDMIIGSMGHTMGSAGGFCTGSTVMCEHQRINSTSFVFSAALPALLATAANETIDNFIRYPEMFTALQENIRAVRAVLGVVDSLEILSHSISPIVHLAIKQRSPPSLAPTELPSLSKGSNATSILTRDPPSFDVAREEALLQDVVDEALMQGVLITRAKRLYGDNDEKQPLGQEWHAIRPTIRLAITSALSKKECEKAATVVKNAWIKVIAKRR
ncbi:hypothetical protein M408DRAFT_333671 [Serendipita vermifera MAFF 305830]|uniref:serine C-palmitoyltransferase n=1 Tax=Serendipita vermifera MAFF 305830 TaxID=933852 RepID=A0A0C3ALX8_SERVB|nr:hypothetical protein M408DRAFT_333671 [Serendipita vermifera MAFF 305830]